MCIRDRSQVADRRVREQALQVVLEDRQVGADEQRREPGQGHDPEPLGRAAQRRIQAVSYTHLTLPTSDLV